MSAAYGTCIHALPTGGRADHATGTQVYLPPLGWSLTAMQLVATRHLYTKDTVEIGGFGPAAADAAQHLLLGLQAARGAPSRGQGSSQGSSPTRADGASGKRQMDRTGGLRAGAR